MKQTGKIALGGVMGALALVCLLLSIIPASEYLMPAVAGAMLLPVVIECGRRWGLLVYGATALLGLLVTPSLEARVLYIAFFGYYPLVKAVLERPRRRLPELLGKLLVFNVSVCLSYWLMIRFLGLPTDVFVIAGHSLPLVMLALGNVTFLLYDRLLTILVTVYMRRLHTLFLHIFHRR